LKYIDISENMIDAPELLCEEFYFPLYSNFSFKATKTEIVVSNRLAINQIF